MKFSETAALDAIGATLVGRTLETFAPHGLMADKFALTLIHHRPDDGGALPRFASQGTMPFYPCSVIKMFHLVAAQAALAEGRIADTPALHRATHDMITWSSNAATNYIIDLLTGTTGDTDLPESEVPAWVDARNAINRYFATLGIADFADINVNQKLMDDDRYGREHMFVQLGGNNHNRLCTNAAATLLAMVMEGELISSERSRIMAGYLSRSRDPLFVATPGAQVLNYMGADLPEGAAIWSKCGWTRDTLASYRRHDAIHVLLPDGQRFTLVAFTQGKEISANFAIMPFIGKTAAALIAQN